MTTKAATPRADPITPRAGFVLPTVGLDRDVWGDLTNQNWNTADAWLGNIADAHGVTSSTLTSFISAVRNTIEPIGSMKIWSSLAVPGGWLTCDGQALSRTDYAQLFAVLGGTWGSGDGSTTFNLPSIGGCAIAHRGAGWLPFASTVGAIAHTLTGSEMPAHIHSGVTDIQGNHSHSYDRPDMRVGAAPGPAAVGVAVPWATSETGAHGHHFNTDIAGGGAAHNNVQPTVGMLIIIKCLNTV